MAKIRMLQEWGGCNQVYFQEGKEYEVVRFEELGATLMNPYGYETYIPRCVYEVVK